MGNSNSNPSRPISAPHTSHSSSPPSHGSPIRAPFRLEPRTLVQSQRRAPARPEPSFAQAQRLNVAQTTSDPGSNLLHQQSLSHSTVSPESQAGARSKDDVKPETRDEPSKPVDFPVSKRVPTNDNRSDSDSARFQSQALDTLRPSPSTQDMSYHLTRPPRMPLPIEEEVHTPGSPIIPPLHEGDHVPILDVADEDTLPRYPSALSNTTIDDDEELAIDKTKATVPTTIEWSEGGGKVYVTGTIFQWNKKHRLHSVPSEPNILRATIHIRPGTHHVRFIVDGDMKCSTNLPTTVDFGNNLVNYIEVSPDDLPDGTPAVKDSIKGKARYAQIDVNEPQIRKPRTKPVVSPSKYGNKIPHYLEDLDNPEGSTAYQYAAAAVEKLPPPPTLPGFLGKPILNAATPKKDDNSVLTMPNHSVLNHLATSSIKDGTLAVSVTTRYKRKYVTTIMYMPTGHDD